MKFTIPFNMSAFLVTAREAQPTPELGTFVWGYRINSPVVFIGLYKVTHQTDYRTYHTIELFDGGQIDVDGIVTIPGQFLPYVVARDNKVHRVRRVTGNTFMTTHGHELKADDVQPVLYHVYDEAKIPSDTLAKEPGEPDLPNRVREEGV